MFECDVGHECRLRALQRLNEQVEVTPVSANGVHARVARRLHFVEESRNCVVDSHVSSVNDFAGLFCQHARLARPPHFFPNEEGE